MTKKRGRVLRDTNSGPGLLVVDGQQYAFALEGAWRSDVPPRAGMAVDVELDPTGSSVAVWAVPENQLAAEQASQVLEGVKLRGGILAQSTVSRFGAGTVVAFVALLTGWFFLTTVSLSGGAEAMDLTFWQLLGYANDSHSIANLGMLAGGLTPSKGIYGLLAVLAIAGSVLRFFWADKRAALGGLLPLFLMLAVFFVLRQHLAQAVGAAGNAFGRIAAQHAMEAILEHVSWGLGAFISLASSLYFAFVSTKKILVER